MPALDALRLRWQLTHATLGVQLPLLLQVGCSWGALVQGCCLQAFSSSVPVLYVKAGAEKTGVNCQKSMLCHVCICALLNQNDQAAGKATHEASLGSEKTGVRGQSSSTKREKSRPAASLH